MTPELEPLVATELRSIQEAIMEAFDVAADGSKITTKRRMRWNNKDLASWVAMLNEHVSRFEERVEILLRACDDVNVAIGAIETVEYERNKFREAVENVQKVVDSLSLAGFSYLASWVDEVNSKMGAVLAKRLQDALVLISVREIG